MNLVFIYLFLGFTISATKKQGNASRCPGDWTEDPSTGSCYKILNEKMLWKTASQKCASQYANARLVKISSSQENEFVKGLFSQAGESNGFWMGANDIQSEGSWVWTDGTSVNYKDWGWKEPNNYDGDEDCAMWRRWWSNGDFKWNDAPCNGRYGTFPAVCEIPVTCGKNEYFDENTELCYNYKVLNDTSRTWYESMSECEAQGAELASIRSSPEWKFVKENILRGVDTHVWLGGSDVQKEGTWLWTDGSPVSFTDWHPGFPLNNSNYNCLGAHQQLNWLWGDVNCSFMSQLYAVCKIQA